MLTSARSGPRTSSLFFLAALGCVALYAGGGHAQDLQLPDAPDRFETRSGNDPLPRFSRPEVTQQLAPLARLPADTTPLSTERFTKPETVQQARGCEEPEAMTGSTSAEPPQTTAVTSPTVQSTDAMAARKVGHGRATFYEHNGRTASGERYSPDGLTAAHHSLPLGSRVRVVNEENGKSVTVRINDRTNEATNRKRPYVIDLSRGAARALDIDDTGSVDIYQGK